MLLDLSLIQLLFISEKLLGNNFYLNVASSWWAAVPVARYTGCWAEGDQVMLAVSSMDFNLISNAVEKKHGQR